MHVTLVENAENDVHDEERGEDEERQRLEKLLQDQAFALQLAFHRRRQHFGRGFLDEIGHVAERHARLRIETKRNAGELVQVVDRLQAQLASSISSAREPGSVCPCRPAGRKAGANLPDRRGPHHPLRG